MLEMEIVCRAKEYIDKLANGINPLDNQPLKDEDVVNDVRLSRCFFCVSNVLREVIENGGVKKSKKYLKNFSISDTALDNFQYSDEPISVTHIVNRINELINQNEMKKLSYKVVTTWLKGIGLIEDANGRYGKARMCPTETGKEMGISIERRVGTRGEYYATYYNLKAQEFIINHVQSFTE